MAASSRRLSVVTWDEAQRRILVPCECWHRRTLSPAACPKSKAPPGGQRGFESLAGFWGLGHDPAKSDLQVSRWLIVPKISLACPLSPHAPFLDGGEAPAGFRQSLLTPPQTDGRVKSRGPVQPASCGHKTCGSSQSRVAAADPVGDRRAFRGRPSGCDACRNGVWKNIGKLSRGTSINPDVYSSYQDRARAW
jgi:hypothetical protein